MAHWVLQMGRQMGGDARPRTSNIAASGGVPLDCKSLQTGFRFMWQAPEGKLLANPLATVNIAVNDDNMSMGLSAFLRESEVHRMRSVVSFLPPRDAYTVLFRWW